MLVTITREVLKEHYKDVVNPEAGSEYTAVSKQVQDAIDGFSGEACSDLRNTMLQEIPKRIDDNLLVCRENCEEIMKLLDDDTLDAALDAMRLTEDGPAGAPPKFAFMLSSVRGKLQETIDQCEKYQNSNSQRVKGLVDNLLPNDFRARLFKAQTDRSEAARKAEVEALIKRGGSVKEKFEMIRKHQNARRERLAMIGNMQGVYKSMLTAVGVPESLLSFVKTLNDENGPIEELRQRFVPSLQDLASFAMNLHLLSKLFFQQTPASADAESIPGIIVQAARQMATRAAAYLEFLETQMSNAPWFISPAQIKSMQGKDLNCEGAISVEIGAGNVYDVEVELESGSQLCWQFNVNSKDIGFSVCDHRQKEVVTGARHNAGSVIEGSFVASQVQKPSLSQSAPVCPVETSEPGMTVTP
mmetsp:Transcript_25350/g.39753  ORF Transcript_25350/g.39753 Transcript_25350/m.39753 type:complete len:415 (-) Transcript_25350:219-1463(-)